VTNPGSVAKNPPNTRTAIAALSEDDLRVKVLVPMLRALGCIKVEDWQGPQENGKDIYFAYHDVLGDVQHCCVFIKQGDITKSGSTDIRKYEAQLREAFNNEFTNPLDNATPVRAGSVYVACNGTINDSARTYLRANIELHFPGRVRLMDIDKIAYLIDVELVRRGTLPATYVFTVNGFADICEKAKPAPAGGTL
jgi:hypothetical protein